jgi:hypothetical protein
MAWILLLPWYICPLLLSLLAEGISAETRFRERRFRAALDAFGDRLSYTVVENFECGAKALWAVGTHVSLPDLGERASSARSIPG